MSGPSRRRPGHPDRAPDRPAPDRPERGAEPEAGRSSRGGVFRLSRRAGRAYQGALEAVLTIPVGLGLGYGADVLLGTDPVGVLVGLGFGFGAFVLRVVRLRSLLEGEVARDEASDADAGAAPGGAGRRADEDDGDGGDSWQRR